MVPGNGGTVIGGIDGGWITVTVLVLVSGTTLVLDSAGAGEVVSVPVDDAQLLCGEPWDWIDAVGTG